MFNSDYQMPFDDREKDYQQEYKPKVVPQHLSNTEFLKELAYQLKFVNSENLEFLKEELNLRLG